MRPRFFQNDTFFLLSGDTAVSNSGADHPHNARDLRVAGVPRQRQSLGFVLFFVFLCLFIFINLTAENRSKVWDPLLTTADGVQVRGTYWQPPTTSPQADAHAVILVHQLGGSRDDWRDLPEKLNQAGYGVFSLELRGHGDRVPTKDHWSRFEEKEFNAMVHDIAAAREWLQQQKKVHIKKIAVIGARLGANVSLKAMKEDEALVGAGCLSPGFSYRKVKVDSDLSGVNDRPLFFVAAEEDTYSANCLKQFEKSGARIKVYPQEPSAHDYGTDLLISRKDLSQDLLNWLKDVF